MFRNILGGTSECWVGFEKHLENILIFWGCPCCDVLNDVSTTDVDKFILLHTGHSFCISASLPIWHSICFYFADFRLLQIPNAQTKCYEILPARSKTIHNITRKIANLCFEYKYFFLTWQKNIPTTFEQGCTLETWSTICSSFSPDRVARPIWSKAKVTHLCINIQNHMTFFVSCHSYSLLQISPFWYICIQGIHVRMW